MALDPIHVSPEFRETLDDIRGNETTERAYALLSQTAGPIATEDKTVLMMRQLARELAESGRFSSARHLTNELRVRQPTLACAHQAELVRVAHKSASRHDTVEALGTLVDDVQRVEGPPSEACREDTAGLLVDLATEWRGEALGDVDDHVVAEPMDSEALSYATQTHEAATHLFTQADFNRLDVCTDRGTLLRRHGQLLYAAGNWAACGPVFEEAVAADWQGTHRLAGALFAMNCRQSAWVVETARLELSSDEERMQATLGRTRNWDHMLAAFQRYTCLANESDAPPEQVATAAYLRAEAFFEGGALWESAVAFRLLAFAPTHGASSRLAASRYAEVMDNLAHGDDICRNELQIDLERLGGMHCRRGEARMSGEGACQSLNAVLKRIRRHIL